MRRSLWVLAAVLGVVIVPQGGSAGWPMELSREAQRQVVCTVAFCSSGCDAGSVNGHVAPDGFSKGGTPHTDCFPGINCGTAHGKCGGGESFLDAPSTMVSPGAVLVMLLEEAAAGDARAMQTLLAVFPDIAAFNDEQGALQVHACDGETLLAHIPVSLEQQAALRSTEE